MTYRDFEGEREALNRAVGTAVRSGHAREPPDVDQHVPAPGDVTVDDVDPGAVELGVLQALGRVERAGGGRGVVEQLDERAHHVVVVVEDLVVVAGRPAEPSFATTGRPRWCCGRPSRWPAGSACLARRGGDQDGRQPDCPVAQGRRRSGGARQDGRQGERAGAHEGAPQPEGHGGLSPTYLPPLGLRAGGG